MEVYLPEHTAIPSGRTAHASDALPGGRGEHILFIDDEPFIAQTGRNILARLGYRVTTHEDPTAALRDYRAAPHSFDLIVTDLTMPHLTGIDLARQALSCRPEQAIIVVSGYTGSWTPESIRALGVRELLNKPLTLDSLAAAVRRVLDQASPQAVP